MEITSFIKLPEVEWDGRTPIYSVARVQYYNDLKEAEENLKEGETLTDLQLLSCFPEYVPPLDINYLKDILPEAPKDIIPKVVEDAMDVFNRSVEGIIISWFPTRFRIKL